MAGAVILGCGGTELTAEERAFFREADPWGFILFARNVENPVQLRRLTADLREAVGRDALITVDQEGGRVQRLRAPQWREWLPPLDQMQAVAPKGPEAQARACWIRSRLMAHELRAVGIDSNCAPTADVAGPETHPFLKNRCFGESPDAVIPAARAIADGLLAGGVLPVIKHMPGHGRATADSHLDLPHVSAPADELARRDFAPFRALNDIPLAMTAHIVFEALDPVHPATSSPKMISVIRDEIGFDGLLMTDDLSMKALSGSFAEKTAAAMAAGCDLALHCNGERSEMEPVVANAGQLSGASAARAARALDLRRLPEPIDTEALGAEFSSLLGRG